MDNPVFKITHIVVDYARVNAALVLVGQVRMLWGASRKYTTITY